MYEKETKRIEFFFLRKKKNFSSFSIAHLSKAESEKIHGPMGLIRIVVKEYGPVDKWGLKV